MKRVAILLAAAGLGSGCVVESSPDQGDAAIYWSFWSSFSHGDFGSLDATATEVCSQGAVDEIGITLVDPLGFAFPTDFGPCITGGQDVPGVVYQGLTPGTWDYFIDGYRGGVLVFSDAFSFDVFDGTTTTVDTNLTALYGDLQLNLDVPTCIASDTIEFDIYDLGNGFRVYSTYAGVTNPPVAVGCLGVPTLVIPSVLPFVSGVSSGNYSLENLTQVDSGGLPVSYPACIPNWSQPGVGKVLSATVNSLSAPLAYCPAG